MSFPVGIDEIIAEYGNYRGFLRSDYTISPSWERAILASCWLPMPMRLGWDPDVEVFKIRLHRKLVESAHGVFASIAKAGLWTQIHTFDGCYAWRQKRGGQQLSLHCWGVAIDLNVGTNQLGTLGDMHPGIVEIFADAGWIWGGYWDRPDPCHFQAAGGY